MAASIRFPVSIFFLLIAAISSVGKTSKCNDLKTYDYVDGCVHIDPRGHRIRDFEQAERECQYYPSERRLPKLDSQEKMDALAAIVINATNTTDPEKTGFWIGLLREKEGIVAGPERHELWKNWTKWHWTSDNSSLKMDNSTYPTWPWKQGDPDGYPNFFCVFAKVVNGSNGQIGLQWDDKQCNYSVPLLVCELVSVPAAKTITTTTTVTSTDPATSTTPITTEMSRPRIMGDSPPTARKGKSLSPWIWVGVVAFALIIGAIPGIVCFIRRRRQQKKKRMQEADDTITMVSNTSAMSGKSANVRSQKEKKAGRKDSVSETTPFSSMFSSRKPSKKSQK